MTEKGITYKFKDAPFEFQYSYTETPKVMFVFRILSSQIRNYSVILYWYVPAFVVT